MGATSFYYGRLPIIREEYGFQGPHRRQMALLLDYWLARISGILSPINRPVHALDRVGAALRQTPALGRGTFSRYQHMFPS